MTATVEQTQSDLMRLIRLAAGGEEIVITLLRNSQVLSNRAQHQIAGDGWSPFANCASARARAIREGAATRFSRKTVLDATE